MRTGLPFIRVTCVLLGLSGLTACGQKGPLYLPETSATETSSESERAREIRRREQADR